MTACSWFSTGKQRLRREVKLPSPGTTCAGRGTIEIGGDVKLAACILIKDVNSTRIIKISFFMVIKLLRVKNVERDA